MTSRANARGSVTSMLSIDAHPVLAEARELAAEIRLLRRAAHSESGQPRTAVRGSLRAENPAANRSEKRAEHHATHLSELDRLRTKLRKLLEDPAHQPLVANALNERARVLRLSVLARRQELAIRAHARDAAEIRAQAAQSNRPLTSWERHRIRTLTTAAETIPGDHTTPAHTFVVGNAWQHHVTTAHRRDAVIEAIGTMRLREARQQLHRGLLLTGQMREIIAEALPALTRGEPVLLVGETGGAKTALAEHLALNELGLHPELVSGYGDITSSQLIGTHELRAEHGATVSRFVPGPLLRAMKEGRPVILDEINAMPAEFLKRLNRILQLRPGDALGVQEDVGREVLIKPGFAILATANEQTPHRYRGLDRLSAELVNRFGANGYRVRYPDATNSYEEFPRENVLLALAAVVDKRGDLTPDLTLDEVTRLARAAFISQQVFAGSHGNGFADFVSTEREIDGRPGLDEAVLAPRTMVAVLQKVAGSAGAITLDRALSRFVESIMHREDRRVLALILEGQGFLIR